MAVKVGRIAYIVLSVIVLSSQSESIDAISVGLFIFSMGMTIDYWGSYSYHKKKRNDFAGNFRKFYVFLGVVASFALLLFSTTIVILPHDFVIAIKDSQVKLMSMTPIVGFNVEIVYYEFCRVIGFVYVILGAFDIVYVRQTVLVADPT